MREHTACHASLPLQTLPTPPTDIPASLVPTCALANPDCACKLLAWLQARTRRTFLLHALTGYSGSCCCIWPLPAAQLCEDVCKIEMHTTLQNSTPRPGA
jgi:hypothetical protein